jgi:DNA-binding IclR family transcriptional regulator
VIGEQVYAPSLPRAQSIQRAVAVLRAVGSTPQGSTAGELAAAASLPRPTVSRLLATLSDAGLVEQVPGGRWVLGSELVRLARAADPYRRIVELARPVVAGLAERTGESATFGAGRRPGEGEVLLQIDAPSLLGATDWVGRTFPAHASGGGKLALARLDDEELVGWLATHPLDRLTPRTITDPGRLRAELRRVRKLGYAETVDELEQGLTGIAVPVRGPEPSTAMALTVSGPSPRFPADRRRELASLAQDAARHLETVLKSA